MIKVRFPLVCNCDPEEEIAITGKCYGQKAIDLPQPHPQSLFTEKWKIIEQTQRTGSKLPGFWSVPKLARRVAKGQMNFPGAKGGWGDCSEFRFRIAIYSAILAIVINVIIRWWWRCKNALSSASGRIDDFISLVIIAA